MIVLYIYSYIQQIYRYTFICISVCIDWRLLLVLMDCWWDDAKLNNNYMIDWKGCFAYYVSWWTGCLMVIRKERFRYEWPILDLFKIICLPVMLPFAGYCLLNVTQFAVVRNSGIESQWFCYVLIINFCAHLIRSLVEVLYTVVIVTDVIITRKYYLSSILNTYRKN